MNYIITNNAYLISKKLFNLSKPKVIVPYHIIEDRKGNIIGMELMNGRIVKLNTVTTNTLLFPVIEHPETGDLAMNVDMEKMIQVNTQSDINGLKNLITKFTVKQIEFSVDAIESVVEDDAILGMVKFGDIIDGFVNIKNDQYMQNEGWF